MVTSTGDKKIKIYHIGMNTDIDYYNYLSFKDEKIESFEFKNAFYADNVSDIILYFNDQNIDFETIENFDKFIVDFVKNKS